MGQQISIIVYTDTEKRLYELTIAQDDLASYLTDQMDITERMASAEAAAIMDTGSALLASKDGRRGFGITVEGIDTSPDDYRSTGNPVPQPYTGMAAVFTLPSGRTITQVELLTAAAAGFADAFGIDEHNMAAAWNAETDEVLRAACEIAIEAIAYNTDPTEQRDQTVDRLRRDHERRRAYTNCPPHFRLADGSKVTATTVVDAAVKRHGEAYAISDATDQLAVWNDLHPLLREAYIHIELEHLNAGIDPDKRRRPGADE